MTSISFVKLYQIEPYVIPDERDEHIAHEFLEKWDTIERPRIGDYIILPDGTYERLSYDWGSGLQTSPSGSFHLGSGYVPFSGVLNPVVPIEKICPTNLNMEGEFWIWHHGLQSAHNGVGLTALCRVFVHADYKGARIRAGSWKR